MTILLTRHDKIGDFITALPMAKVLKEHTNHKIVFLVSSVNVVLAKNCSFIDSVIEYSTDVKELVKRLKLAKIDISISAFIDMHLGICLYLSNIKTRISPATKIAQIFFNKRVKQKRSLVKKKEWEYNLDLVLTFDSSISICFDRPLLQLSSKKNNFIIFHVGSGGSSDGNLSLKDYLRLAKKASKLTEIVFTFGPNDNIQKSYIIDNLDFNATIKDDFDNTFEFAKFISLSQIFISTSTGPMHLAGISNTRTISFFGDSLFASSNRWATVSCEKFQNNYQIPNDYKESKYLEIETRLSDVVLEIL
jgi:ADP-heptose:LPS heptosyltransferase